MNTGSKVFVVETLLCVIHPDFRVFNLLLKRHYTRKSPLLVQVQHCNNIDGHKNISKCH